MDWRTGKPNAPGSAFRGIGGRGRGRGRGRATPPSGRGGHASESASPAPTPSNPPVQVPASGSTTPTSNLPPRPKPAPRRGSHHARRAPSLSHLDLPKSGATSAEQQANNTSPPQVTRRASHNPIGVSGTTTSQLQIPSVKLDPSSPSTPSSPRPKPSRKRSQNRTRSSSKVSSQDRLSATASVASLKDRVKETPPHLAMASAPPDVQSFDLRTNIDTLVERVRAMAMAGSAVDKDKDKEGHYTPNDGHIDWAGDEDDTLPDLDDWVRPKSAEPKEVQQTPEDSASVAVLSPVEEISSNPPSNEKGKRTKEQTTVSNDVTGADKKRRAEESKQVKRLKATNEVNSVKEKESTSSRTKTRGKHSRKKSSASESLTLEANSSTPLAKSSSTDHATPASIESSTLSTPTMRPPLVHPLPPKPQVTPSPARGPRARALPPHAPVTIPTQPASRVSEDTLQEKSPPEDKPALAPPAAIIETNTIDETSGASSEPIKKKVFDPTIDWAKAPRVSENSQSEAAPESKDGEDSLPASIELRKGERTFDSNVDWANAPRLPQMTSPTRKTPSPKRGRPFSSPSHPHTAPPHGRHRLHPSSGSASPSVFPDISGGDLRHAQTRSQMNSPESSPRRWLNREGSTHLRSHSSPQTGPGTRMHASRPVITVDAISRISRSLGAAGATTPPRSQAVALNE